MKSERCWVRVKDGELMKSFLYVQEVRIFLTSCRSGVLYRPLRRN